MGDDVDGAGANEVFGTVVSLSRDGFRLAVGGEGVARVYQWTSAAWVPMGSEDLDTFGATTDAEAVKITSVSISGDGSRVAVGERDADGDKGALAGRVRVHEWSATAETWEIVGGKLEAEAEFDRFGSVVSLSSRL